MDRNMNERIRNWEIKVLKSHDLVDLLGISRVTLHKKINDGTFPRPFKLGKRLNGWLLSDVEAWIKEQNNKAQKISS